MHVFASRTADVSLGERAGVLPAGRSAVAVPGVSNTLEAARKIVSCSQYKTTADFGDSSMIIKEVKLLTGPAGNVISVLREHVDGSVWRCCGRSVRCTIVQ